MKLLLSILFASVITFAGAQKTKGPSVPVESSVYIVEESYEPRKPQRWKTEKPSYVQIISQDYFVLSIRTRGDLIYFEGDIETWIETTNKTHFYVQGIANRPVISFDILRQENIDNITLHMYHMLGRYDKYFSARLATPNEIKELEQYNIKD